MESQVQTAKKAIQTTYHEATGSTKLEVLVSLFIVTVGHWLKRANGDFLSARGALMSTSHEKQVDSQEATE